MAHGVGEVLSDGSSTVKIVNNSQHSQNHNNQTRKPVGVMGSRRIFAAAFKLKVLDSYRNDIDCRGNQRATARKYGIHRRQIQKWLQCEENLRSSCAESTTNTSVIVGNSVPSTSGVINTTGINIISTTSISKTGEPTIVTTTSGINPVVPVATSAPALNLSLARLHGDELANRQGPPPSSHPTLHRGSSPTSAQYNQHNVTSNSLPVHALLISYTEYTGQDLHHQQQLLHHRAEDSGMHGYQMDRTGSPNERKYYVLNHPNYEQSSGYRGGSDARLYHQTQPPTYQATSGHGYSSIVSRDHRIHGIHQSPGHVQPSGVPLSNSSPASSHAHLRDVDSPGNESLAPAIKAERASPDSPATPVPCNEAPSSPGITTTTSTRTVYPVSQHTRIPSSGIATQAVTAVHFETPRRTSPEAHVHVSVDTHTSTVDSKKQDHHSKLVYVKREDDRGIEVKDELPDVCVPKEEILEEHDDTNNAVVEDRDGSNYSADAGFDYSAAPVLLSRASSDVHSGTLSPVRDTNFSGPSSPRGAASSSSRSTSSSCSDSEVDALDYSSTHQNTTSDLSRRRSFSLRFKLDVLDAFHGDAGVAGNQRATARKFGINRRQVQKWLGQETELRGEIALRGGDMRQRLGPLQELPGESAVDLRTGSIGRSDADMDHSSSPIYCCDSSSQRLGYYPSLADAEVQQRTCTLSCCADNLTTSSVTSCYPDSKRACYPESHGSYYCYSPRDSLDNVPQDGIEMTSLPLKRTACNLSCCYDIPSPKRLCVETECSISNKESCQDQPPQEAPLCLVKSKRSSDASPLQTERVTSTVPTPPAPAALAQPTKKDGILFKPYLDNPVSKPTDDTSHHYYHQRDLSPLNNHQGVIVNNNNCSSICNLNEERGHDYAVELSLRVPVSWRAPSHVAEFPERIRSAFARYPAIPHYI